MGYFSTDEIIISYSYYVINKSERKDDVEFFCDRINLLFGLNRNWLEFSSIFVIYNRINKNLFSSNFTEYETVTYQTLKKLGLFKNEESLKMIYDSFLLGSYKLQDSKSDYIILDELPSISINKLLNTEELGIELDISDSDYPQPALIKSTSVEETYLRSKKVVISALIKAEFKCEIDPNHFSFYNQLGRQYLEAHHIIPLSYQENFNNSLDVVANIVALCPNCHRNIHYGVNRNFLVSSLFIHRRERLIRSGIIISLSELMTFYN